MIKTKPFQFFLIECWSTQISQPSELSGQIFVDYFFQLKFFCLNPNLQIQLVNFFLKKNNYFWLSFTYIIKFNNISCEIQSLTLHLRVTWYKFIKIVISLSKYSFFIVRWIFRLGNL